jgi:PGF-CTERM protein
MPYDKTTTERALTACLLAATLALAAGLASPTVAAQETATVSVEDVQMQSPGDTAQTTVTVTAPNGIGVADAVVSVDTSVAEITAVSPGSDVDTSQATTQFETDNRTDGSVTIRYTNIAEVGSVQDFELAVVEFEAVGEGTSEISLRSPNLADDTANDYQPTETSAELSVQQGSENPADSPGEETGDSTETDPDEGSGTDGSTTDSTEQTSSEDTDGGSEDTETTDDGQDTVPNETDEDSTEPSETGVSEESQEAENETEGNDSSGSQGMPGFTPLVALISIIVAAVLRAGE